MVLRHAGKLVAPGGVLLYCTCSFMVEENDVQVGKGKGGGAELCKLDNLWITCAGTA